MLTVPSDLDESALAPALRGGWKIDVGSMSYLPVGWGSHHWDVHDRDGMRWFVTVDELENKRVSNDESVADGFARLRASLRTAVALRHAGCEFVVAPAPARDGECGPYTTAAARLLREHAAPLRRWLDHYDDLVAVARARPERNVLTHGEPHPGNVMRTRDGWRLIDWDTSLVAPPERDLWHLASGDGTVPGAYPAATGITPLPELIELYRLGWDVKDTAVDAARFFRPHADSADDVKTWKLLNMLVSWADG